MKIQELSDLHFEHHYDLGRDFIASLNSEDVDVLILAGDIAEPDVAHLPIRLLSEKYKQIIYVAGNHDYYNSNREKANNIRRQLCRKYPNVHYLDNQILEIEGQRFLGTTLWFQEVSWDVWRQWSDFYDIENFDTWVFKANKEARNWLCDNLQKNDIVITHYLPSWKSVSKEFEGNWTNCFFVCDMEKLIEDRQPRLFCHGHTHKNCDYYIGNTRVICNPFGYKNRAENPDFNDHLIIEI